MIYVIRHGQTDWNLEGRTQGSIDTELNETGRCQANSVRNELLNTKLDVVLCSPRNRCKSTAEIICQDRDIPIIGLEDLRERDFGEFEGMFKKDFNYNAFWSYKQNLKYDEAENITEFFRRVYDFLDSVKKEYEGKRVLIVAHAGVSIPVKCYFEGIPNQEYLSSLHLENCEVVKYSY